MISTDERVGDILEDIRVSNREFSHWAVVRRSHWAVVRRGGGLRERHKRGEGQRPCWR